MPICRLCFDINSNSYFQNNQVLTKTKSNQPKLRERERERERETTYNRELKNITPKRISPK